MPGKDNHRPLTSKTKNVSKPPKVATKAEKERELYKAARDGDLEKVVKLLSEGVDANHIGCSDGTPLIKAAINGHEKIVEILLQVENIDVNAADKYGQTALHRAVESGNKGVVIILLKDPRVDVNNSIIESAVSHDKEEIFDILIQDNRVDENYLDHNVISLLVAAIYSESEKFVTKFLSYDKIGANINERELLVDAIYLRNKEIFEKLWKFPGIDRSRIMEEELNWLESNDLEIDSADWVKYKQEVLWIIKNDNPEIHDAYEVLGVSTDDSSDTHSNSSGNLSAESPDEISVDSANEVEITGAKNQSLEDFLS